MKRIVLHQTLHGYSEGHRLLDGSLKLADEPARIILRMSDLSGSNVVSGFEEYLTAYPLATLGLYALAKTWYALEMPRPGCVWTHTLFIPFDIMGDIPDLQALSTLFVRPQKSTNFIGYAKAIEFEIPPGKEIFLEDVNAIQISDLIETLYRQDKNNVLVGTQSSGTYEAALFRIWSQQWPQLRKVFTFCTGALSARGFAGKPFDIQCAPVSLVREITAASVVKQSQEMNPLAKTGQEQPSWFAQAVDDAIRSNGGLFRKLLWKFADTSEKKNFPQFAQLIVKCLNSKDHSVSEIITWIAELFPTCDSGAGLKSALFGNGREVSEIKSFDEGEVLAALATSPYHAAFNSEALCLKDRGRNLCHQHPDVTRRTISKMFRSPMNSLGEDILAGMVEGTNPIIARSITSEQPQFLPALFRAKPELGTSAELWLSVGDRQRELFEALTSHQNLETSLIEKIVEAMLDGHADYFLRNAVESWGDPAVFGTMNWLAKNTENKLSERSCGALTFHVETIVKWILSQKHCPSHTAIIAGHIIAPYSYQFCKYDSSVWLNTYKDLMKSGDEKEMVYFAALLLALGFQDAPPNALELVVEFFEKIHKITWDEKMPDETWIILEPLVPHLWWIHEWDRCERLRRGLIEAFIRNRWPLIKLAACVKDQIFLDRVIMSAEKVDGGKQFVSRKF